MGGGTSLTKVSLNLLEEASKKHYKYYHLISGQDLPLKNQKDIHDFFDNSNKNFISLSELNGNFYKRIDYFYPLQNITSKHNIFNRIWRKIIVNIFDKLHIRRKRKYSAYGLGSQWFSITDEFAQYVVSKKKEILKNFKMTLISDEIWLQTIWMNSPFINSNSKYVSHKHNEYIEEIYFDVVRSIDFTRGNPYVYKDGDYDYLMNTGCMFARKFDENVSGKLIDKICDKVRL